MIRRTEPNAHCLITQHDHALLSGRLARQIGNKLFDPPHPLEPVCLGIGLHDCGWPLHDDQPTLNSRGLPLDVFETPREIALRVWQESVDRAYANDAYAGFLTSLHVLALSVPSTSPKRTPHPSWDMSDPKTRFEVNRFQHKQIEFQEHRRREMGMRTDIPLLHGLADDSTDPQEQTLVWHVRLLQCLDLVSLALCCTDIPVEFVKLVPTRSGGRVVSVKLRREAE
ncbi:MAG: DUF3891 family protein, partial [Tepidisphaeraceae bacterium]